MRRGAIVQVDEALVPELLDDPPDGLDVVAVVGDVGVVHIDPEADALREGLPFLDVAEDALAAAAVELLDAELLDLRLALEAELALDFELDRKAVSIPAGLAGDAIAPH